MCGFGFGMGFFILVFAKDFSSVISPNQMQTLYYLGFGIIIISIVFAAYVLSTVHKTIGRVKSGKTPIA
jgi:hypothetical protein